MNCVLPGLYISGIISSRTTRLKDTGITHVLSILSGEVKQEDYDKSCKRLCIDADDDDQQDLSQHFPKAISFIHDARISGGKCLVHCIAGISRSSTVVIAYVMTLTGWKWREAFASIKGNHQRAFPNLNFQKQLLTFEKRSSKDKGSREQLRATLMNDYTPTAEEMKFLEEGKAKFDSFVKSGIVR